MAGDGIYLPTDTYHQLNADLFEQDARGVVADAWHQQATAMLPDMVQQAQEEQQRQEQAQRAAAVDQFSSAADSYLSRIGAWATPDQAAGGAPSPPTPADASDQTGATPSGPAASPPSADMPQNGATAAPTPTVAPVAANPAATSLGNNLAAQSYQAYARQAAQKAGVDPDIFQRQIQQESGFDPTAKSGAGAVGIAQIMPQYHPGVDPTDPIASLDYAANLMAANLKANGGDYAKALAAYNAGQGNVDKYGGVPPFEETQHYVSSILNGQPAAASGPTSGAGRVVTAAVNNVVGALRPSQFGVGLSDAAAYAACGPVAAMAFARATGQNPTAEQAVALAKQVGWTPGQGMAGPGSELDLLKNMGVPAHMENGADPAKIAQDVQNGNPVIISTAGHYFVADGYDPKTGSFHVGTSGTDLKAGSEWMSLDQMQRVMGSAQATLYLDRKPGDGPSVAAQMNQQTAAAQPTDTTAPAQPQSWWDKLGTGIADVFKNTFGGGGASPAPAAGMGFDPSHMQAVTAPDTGVPLRQDIRDLGQPNQPTVFDQAGQAFGATAQQIAANPVQSAIDATTSIVPGARDVLATGNPLDRLREMTPTSELARGSLGMEQIVTENRALFDQQQRLVDEFAGAQQRGDEAAMARIRGEMDVLQAQLPDASKRDVVHAAAERNPSTPLIETSANLAGGAIAAPLAVEGAPMLARAAAAAIDPGTGVPALLGHGVEQAVTDVGRAGADTVAADRLVQLPGGELAPIRTPAGQATSGKDLLQGMIDEAARRGMDPARLAEMQDQLNRMPAQATVRAATTLGGAAAGGGAAYVTTDENDPNRWLKVAGGAAGGAALTNFGISAARGAMTATQNAQSALPGFAGAVTGPELFRAYHTGNVVSGLPTLTHVTVSSTLAPAWSFGTRGLADIAGGAAGLATGGHVGLDTGFSRVQGSGIGMAAALATAGEDFGAALANYFTNPATVANRAGGVMGMFLNAQSAFGALHGAAQAAAQGIIARTELGRLAGEEATRQGLKGQAWIQAVTQMIHAPLGGMLQEATAVAQRAALRGDLGTIGSKMQDVANVPYVGNTLFPVVKISTNALSQGIEKSPLGLLGTGFDVARGALGHGPYGGPAGFAGNGVVAPLSERLTNNIAGSALTAWLASKALDGSITGDGPDDPGQKAELMAQGWQPNSVLVPGKGYVDYHLLGPLAIPFALAGSYADAVNYSGPKGGKTTDAGTIAGSMTKQMGKYLEDATGLRTIGQIYDIFHTQGVGASQGAKAIAQFGSSLAGGFVPFSAFDRGVATATDPYARKAAAQAGDLGSLFTQDLSMGIPGLREQNVPVKQDLWGQPELSNQAGLGVFSPRTGLGSPDPNIQALMGSGVKFPSLPTQVSVSSKHAIDLTPQEKEEYQTLRGRIAQQIIQELTADPGFASASIEKRQQYLQKAFAAADKQASKELVSQIPNDQLVDRAVANQARRAPVGVASP